MAERLLRGILHVLAHSDDSRCLHACGDCSMLWIVKSRGHCDVKLWETNSELNYCHKNMWKQIEPFRLLSQAVDVQHLHDGSRLLCIFFYLTATRDGARELQALWLQQPHLQHHSATLKQFRLQHTRHTYQKAGLRMTRAWTRFHHKATRAVLGAVTQQNGGKIELHLIGPTWM